MCFSVGEDNGAERRMVGGLYIECNVKLNYNDEEEDRDRRGVLVI